MIVANGTVASSPRTQDTAQQPQPPSWRIHNRILDSSSATSVDRDLRTYPESSVDRRQEGTAVARQTLCQKHDVGSPTVRPLAVKSVGHRSACVGTDYILDKSAYLICGSKPDLVVNRVLLEVSIADGYRLKVPSIERSGVGIAGRLAVSAVKISQLRPGLTQPLSWIVRHVLIRLWQEVLTSESETTDKIKSVKIVPAGRPLSTERASSLRV